MKTCDTCKLPKALGEFNKNRAKKDGLNSICRECSRARSKKYYQDNLEAHKKIMAAKRDRLTNLNREKIIDYLSTHPCVSCGETDIVVLQFDHLRDKAKGISELISSYSWETISKEIEKCQVLCANCHARKTAKTLNNYRIKHQNKLG